MIYFGFGLVICILGWVIYTAIDKKTDRITRLVSIVALGVMVLTVIICLFIALTDKTVPFDESVLIVGAPPATKEDDGNSMTILLFSIFMIIALYLLVTFLALREQKRNAPKKNVQTKTADSFQL